MPEDTKKDTPFTLSLLAGGCAGTSVVRCRPTALAFFSGATLIRTVL